MRAVRRWSCGRFAVVVVVVALLTASCSGDSEDGSSARAGASGSGGATTCDGTATSDPTVDTSGASTSLPPLTADRYTTANTPIGTLVDDPAARAVLERYLPDLVSSSSLELIRHTSLKEIQGYGASVFTDELMAQIDAGLAELTPLTPEEGGGPVIGDVNYDEARVRPYELPDPLVLSDGAAVCDESTWWDQRRAEIYDTYETEVYGVAPERPSSQHFEIVEPATPAFDGEALRTQVRIELTDGTTGPGLDLVEYVPASATGPVPMLLMLGFGAPTSMFGDPDFDAASLPPEVAAMAGAFPMIDFLEAGFGVAAINYLDLDPDSEDGYPDSVRAVFDDTAEADRRADAWGAVAAWGWGLSRAQDYLETDPAVDADRVAIYGASRLGRAVLWAGARDQRFAAVISCCSGKFGASLLRRDFGDSLDALPDYWFASNLVDHVDDIDALPVDAHLLLALIAPRPVLLQTGRYDHAADPKGEFLAAVASAPVYQLLGGDVSALTDAEWPPAAPILDDVGFVLHEGGHGTSAEDWPVFLGFLERHLDSP